MTLSGLTPLQRACLTIIASMEAEGLSPSYDELRACGWATNGDGDADGFTFCGARRHVGSPYCSDHHRIAYRPAPPRPPSAVKDTAQRAAKTDDSEPKPLDFEKAA